MHSQSAENQRPLTPPEGSGPNANNWTVTDAGSFPVGASITTPNSLLMGYGFEGVSTKQDRNAVMRARDMHLPTRSAGTEVSRVLRFPPPPASPLAATRAAERSRPRP